MSGQFPGSQNSKETEGQNAMYKLILGGRILLISSVIKGPVFLKGIAGPDLPVAPQDEAGLTKTFQTWPRGWFHIP